MPSLCLEAVRFHYEDPYCPVFDDATLELDTAWRTGLIGRNGLGKSTLIGLIAGGLVPYAGRVRCPLPTTRFPAQIADPRADTLAVVRECVAPFATWRSEMDALVEAGDPASLDRYGAIALELERHDGYRVDERIEEEWSRMGLAPNRLGAAFDSLSGGEQTHALMVALFLGPPRFALIDEPTNHLDAAGRARLGDYLADKSGFLLVSHDRAFLDRCVDHVVALEGVARQPGALRVMETDYSGYREQRRRERGFADRERERLEREVRDLDAAARKRRGWSDRREKQKNTGHADRGYEGRRAAKLMKRALHVEQRAHDKLDEKRALLHRPEKSRVLKLESKARDRATLIVADRLSVRAGARTLVADFSLRVRRGDRIAFVGANGCGKTWLLDVLARDRAPSGGSVSHPRPVSIARSHQHPRFASGRLAAHLERAGLDQTGFRNVLGVFGMEGELFDRPLETFSEGECKKADLVPSFLAPADVLIWDEPLNFLDIESREQIESVILEDAPTLLFVEHDRVFVEHVATRIFEFARDGALLERPVPGPR